jgi:spore coat polysaccharide biosynthesis protein SpsF
MKFTVVVAARTSSSRLPGKALLPLGGVPMIRYLLRRIATAKLAHEIVFATTTGADDDELAAEVAAEGVRVFRGAREDVVKRYADVAREIDAEYLVRVTGDCPFTDGETLDHCLRACTAAERFDLASTKGRFPVGIDYEVFRAETLARLHASDALDDADREHLTKYFYDHAPELRIVQLEPRPEWRRSTRPFTVDTEDDYRFAQTMVAALPDPAFSVADLVREAEARS